MCQYGMSESKSATFPIEKARHLLDDSFLESQSPVRNDPHCTSVSNGLSVGRLYTVTSLNTYTRLFHYFLLTLELLITVQLYENKSGIQCKCSLCDELESPVSFSSEQGAVKARLGRGCHLEWKGESQSLTKKLRRHMIVNVYTIKGNLMIMYQILIAFVPNA